VIDVGRDQGVALARAAGDKDRVDTSNGHLQIA
jgi:hypothetical protein